jgi:hypothetical protein
MVAITFVTRPPRARMTSTKNAVESKMDAVERPLFF